ncbi:hypothetical protein N7462_006969 [Penicillium macrosclerotiorum]|uniref:uncharacterized protein n=1 Tax=Penicillium macrosclerotiorum TaxID=303699 RepID=UPI002546A5FC|nr:uncharacterized protein N7462_006969 [Penicillium macrosclerotiorum]KAJ5678725.1 hypothetical protein N7462_006969 [Penicillium macrosclerotiorum]
MSKRGISDSPALQRASAADGFNWTGDGTQTRHESLNTASRMKIKKQETKGRNRFSGTKKPESSIRAAAQHAAHAVRQGDK